MLEHLKNDFNKTTTQNGADAFLSTNSKVLDLFSQGGAYRYHSDSEIERLFSKAMNEDSLLALKTLFYLRDVRGGQGERNFFKVSLKHLAKHDKGALSKNIAHIPEFGRWDDMWVLLETDLKDEVLKLVKAQFEEDCLSEHPSLLAKWSPSQNASSATTRKYGKIIQKGLGMTPRQYRKMLSSLRKKLNLVETNLTNKEYGKIEYDKIPSKAGMMYRGAFNRNDYERYSDFLESLSNGDVKVNSSTLYPSDIVGKMNKGHFWGFNTSSLTDNEVKLLEGQWKNLPNYIGEKKEDSIVMADVSGSMSGTPMNVAISLALYIAERNKGAYKNHFMTFSSNPELVEIQGANIVDKANNIGNASWGYSTNIEKALLKLLDVAVENNLPNDEVVKKLYIVSDMQFDSAVEGDTNNIFKNVKKRFEEEGYDFPNIVFWNVYASGNTPMTMNENGVQLVSGYSPTIMKNLLNSDGKTPYDFMLEVIDSERYEKITL